MQKGTLKSLIGCGLLILALAFALAAPSPVNAAESYTLQISPTHQDLDLAPGETYRGTFKLRNPGEKSLNFAFSASPYWADGDDYESDFSTSNNYTFLSSWVTFDQPTLTIEPYTIKDIAYTITVPSDAPAGGQYAALIASVTDPTSSPSNIQITGSIGLILYANIAGETHQSGTFIAQDIPTPLFGQPIAVSATLENTGNTDFTITTNLKITDAITNQVVYDNSDNPDIRHILPGTTRCSVVTWTDTPALGIFKVTQSLTYLDQQSEFEKIVIVCPVWLLVALCVIFVLVALLFIIKITKLKKSARERKALI